MFNYKVDKDYIKDCEEVQKYLKPHFGEVPLIVCEALWSKFSESWCAGWLCLSPSILNSFKEWLIKDLNNEDGWEIHND